MITQENRLPYDRPQLTKEYLEGKSDDDMLPLRSEEFYKDHDIECMLDSKVKKVAIPNRLITLENGDEITYDSLLVATGGIPRTLDVPGSDLQGIFTLRNWDDSSAIIKAAQLGSRVVIVGTSFIGIESAYSLSQRQLSVTVVGVDSVPFEECVRYGDRDSIPAVARSQRSAVQAQGTDCTIRRHGKSGSCFAGKR